VRRLLSFSILTLAACVDSADPTAPATPESRALGASSAVHGNDKLRIAQLSFDRYVAMGNSITAGFISGGISQNTQGHAYPVVLAQRFGVPFNLPLLALPGCPAPFTAPLTPAIGTPPCAGRANNLFPPNVNDVAVPGIRLAEALTLPTGSTGALQQLLLGPYTQVQAMQLAQPTFVSVALGNNDALQAALAGVLGPATPGGPDLLTSLSDFHESYSRLVATLNAVPTLSGAVLIGVFDPVISVPLLQPGAFFFLARDAAGKFQGKLVNNNCSPVNALGQPNPLSANLVSGQIVIDALFPEINCDPAAYPVGDPRRGTYLLDATEQTTIRTRVAQYNEVIAAAAARNGWAYVDPNSLVLTALATRINGRADLIRKCQDLATATTAAQFQAAVLNTCPVTGPTAAPNLFGLYISFDGVHPSAQGHVALANIISAAINATYGTALPVN
jgi:lysophospholipase L1-like esterase